MYHDVNHTDLHSIHQFSNTPAVKTPWPHNADEAAKHQAACAILLREAENADGALASPQGILMPRRGKAWDFATNSEINADVKPYLLQTLPKALDMWHGNSFRKAACLSTTSKSIAWLWRFGI